MTRKIFRSILLAAAVALLASLATVMGVLYPYFSDLQERELGEELKLTATAVEQGGLDYLETLTPGTVRVTWVAGDGTVLYDSEADPASMENHADRREIRDALAYGQGSDSRTSATLLEETMYRAQRLGDGTVLRLSARRAAGLMLRTVPWASRRTRPSRILAVIWRNSSLWRRSSASWRSICWRWRWMRPRRGESSS